MEAIVFSTLNEPDTAELFPYTTMKIDVPQCRPATKLLKGVNMSRMYSSASVHEQQELGLDPIYVADRSLDPTKVRLLEVQVAPVVPILAILTTYGACQILAKDTDGRDWKYKVADITQLLITTVFPIEVSPCDMKAFTEMRDFVNLYNCTACCWHDSRNIIYAANARAYIIAFRIKELLPDNEISKNNDILEYHCKIATDFGRICYLKSFDDFLIAVNTEGRLALLKFSHGNMQDPSIEYITNLWNQRDQMCCRQIVVQKYAVDGMGYTILCAKGTHLLCFQISTSGELKCTKVLLIPGIKISGLELFDTNEVIVTTIIGKILHVRFEVKDETSNDISVDMKAKPITAPQIDITNYQILGLGASRNRALWFFLIYPNKDLNVAGKQNLLPSQILLCMPSTLNPAQRLLKSKIDKMDPYRDLVLALRMNIWHLNVSNEYNKYFSLGDILSKSQQIDDAFLLQLQINLEIYRATVRRSNYKLQIVNGFVQDDMKFPELSLQLAHILLRLEYLQSVIISKGTETKGFQVLTTFQQAAARTMRKVFFILIEELKEIRENVAKRDSSDKEQEIVQNFLYLFQREMNIKWQNYELEAQSPFEEKCCACQEPIAKERLTCQSNHNVQRCNVSFIQQTWFNDRYCSQCGTVATNFVDSRDILTELFPPNESVKCTFCRSDFISKEQL